MSKPPAAPQCQKCGTVAVPSYLVLSPTLLYWRCPDCVGIWTTLKSAIEQHQETYAQRSTRNSARAHCPQCDGTEVVDLADVLRVQNALTTSDVAPAVAGGSCQVGRMGQRPDWSSAIQRQQRRRTSMGARSPQIRPLVDWRTRRLRIHRQYVGASGDGYFYVLDARTSERLWQMALAGSIQSGPMSYSVGGKQYVAVAAGNTLFAFGLR